MKTKNRKMGKILFKTIFFIVIAMSLSYLIWAAQTTTSADFPDEEYAILGDLDVDADTLSDDPHKLRAFDANIRCEDAHTHSSYGVGYYGGIFDAIGDDTPGASYKHDVYTGSLSRAYLNHDNWGYYDGGIGVHGACVTYEYDGSVWLTKKIHSAQYIIGGKFTAIPDMVGPTPTSTPLPNIDIAMGVQATVSLCNNDDDSDLFVDIDTVIAGDFEVWLDENKPITVIDLYGVKVNIEDTDDANTAESIVNAYGIYVNDITDELSASGDCYSIYSDGPVKVNDDVDIIGDVSINDTNDVYTLYVDTVNDIVSIGGSDTSHSGVLKIYEQECSERIRLHSSGSSFINGGNVGIGTSSPSEKLHVNGKALTEEDRWKDWFAVAACSQNTVPSNLHDCLVGGAGCDPCWHPDSDTGATSLNCGIDALSVFFPVPYEAGTVIKAIRVKWQAEGANAGVKIRLIYRDESGTATSWSTVGSQQTYTDSSAPYNVTVSTYTLPSTHTMLTNNSYTIEVESEIASSGVKLYSIGIQTSNRVY